jgi:ubiquinone/menaquinone biosynthesis C-methylase UbiE
MAERKIRFEDGAAYERMSGIWSRLVGAPFLDWLAPAPGLRWIDIGCGNGAFTELIVDRCAPSEVQGIDPSADQLVFARSRPSGRIAEFRHGDAMELPFPDNRFDAAVMALVIFFVPDPVRSVAEMARVAFPGGIVASYTWDMFGGGFHLEPFRAEMQEMGITLPFPPSADASRVEALRDLWAGAGLDTIQTRVITAQRTFADFDDFWTTGLMSSVGRVVAEMTPDDVDRLKTRLRARLPADAAGHVTYSTRANAIRGRVPG